MQCQLEVVGVCLQDTLKTSRVLLQCDNCGFSELGSGWAQGTSRRQWHALAQRRNAANDRFPARPKGGTQMSQYGVAALEKDMPFSAVCALSWNIWVPLNP